MNGCKKDEPNPLETLQDDLTTGTWFISELTVDNNEITGQFEQYRLAFTLEKDPESPQMIFNKLLLSDTSNTFRGTWIFFATNEDEEYKNSISIAFVNNNEFQSISARWGVKSHTKGKIELIKEAEELSPDRRVMVLGKH